MLKGFIMDRTRGTHCAKGPLLWIACVLKPLIRTTARVAEREGYTALGIATIATSALDLPLDSPGSPRVEVLPVCLRCASGEI